MTRVDAPPRTASGRPLWQVLLALALLPALAATGLAVLALAGWSAQSRGAATVRADVTVVEALAAVRRGVGAEQRAALLPSDVRAPAGLRKTTDAALLQLSPSSAATARTTATALAATVRDTGTRLSAARALVDGRSAGPAAVARAYDGATTVLAAAQDSATGSALLSSPDPRTTAALLRLQEAVRTGQPAGSADEVGTSAARARAAADDRAAALRALASALVQLCAALVLVSAAAALLVDRWIAGRTAVLAVAALGAAHGDLTEVVEAGPRELRSLARALSGVVVVLNHLQQQIGLVRQGRTADVLALPAPPGALSRDVQAWALHAQRSEQVRDELERQLSHQAAHDSLTGLAVRSRVLEQLAGALELDRAAGRRTALVLVDLDGFQAVNDRHGHAAGDELLRVVADRLRSAARVGDVVGRLGGDEFVVVVPDAPDADALVRSAGRLVGVLAEPVQVGGYLLSCTASAGVALRAGAGQGEGQGAEVLDAAAVARTLLVDAATAAHRAKAAGRARVELFDDDLRSQLAEAASTEQALRTALALGQLRVVYQPVVGLPGPGQEPVHHVDGELLGVEALLRWDRPGHGPVDPAVVVAAAERCGLVRGLEAFVLAEAALQLVRWRVRGRDVPVVSVNLSARHLADPRVVPDVLEALETAGLEPSRLQVEISEGVLVDDGHAAEHLRALRSHGVRVALDDFGTGATSIAALATTPADQLKVAGRFVAAEGAADEQLLELMARAGTAFGLEVVAEGVETAAQAERALRAGCTGAQGWHFCPALSADELEPRLPLLRDSRAEVRAPVR